MNVSTNEAQRAKEIFLKLASVEDIAAREAAMERLVGSDNSLKQQVLELLEAADDLKTSLLDRVSRALGGRALVDGVSITLGWATGSNPGGESDVDRSPMIGPYKLLEQIGEGGMGVVYVAEQSAPIRRRVAIKLIKPGMDSKQVVARFLAERQALAMMNHPNIAKVLDAGTTENGLPYFVMELVKGIPITEYCDHHKLDLRQRLELFMVVCEAVQHAHQKGVIHRDLKPQNVLVELEDVRSVPKVIDSGVAKALQQPLVDSTVYTGFAQMIGTPLYMSPEQAEFNSLDADTRSDVYSLGVILYELITGSTPFDRETFKKAGFDEIRRIIREDEPPRPSSRMSNFSGNRTEFAQDSSVMRSTVNARQASTLSGYKGVDLKKLRRVVECELDWIVMKSLEKDRSRRYESAIALAADVSRFLEGEPVAACPPTVMYRTRKFARKNKIVLLTSLTVLCAMLVGTAMSVAQAARATRAEGIAQSRLENEQAALIAEQKARTEAEDAREVAEGHAVEAYRHQYQAQMQLANVDLVTGNLTRLYQTLISHLPEPGRIDRRGWEWYYLLSRSQEGRTLFEHYAQVNTMAWSPDGRFLATVSSDGQAIVWDVRAGRIARRFNFGPTLKRGVCWSPDSQRLAWGSVDDENAVRVWDSRTDDIQVLYGHTGSLVACAWSPDGTKLATGSMDSTARIWDVESGECEHILGGHLHHVNAVDWLADGKSLITAGHGGVKLWDTETWEQLREELTEYVIITADISDDATAKLVLGTDRGECLVVDTTTWDVNFELPAHAGEVHVVAIDSNGKYFASSGSEGTILWSLADGKKQETLRSHRGPVLALAWHPAGNQIAVAHTDGGVELWDHPMPARPLTVQGVNEAIQSLTWGEDDRELTAETQSGLASYGASTGKLIHQEPCGPEKRLATSPDGNFYSVAERKGNMLRIEIRESVQKEIVCELEHPLSFPDLWPTLVWSPDNRRLALYEFINFVVWELPAGQRVFSWNGPVVRSLAWTSDSRRLAVAGGGDSTDNGTQQYSGFVHVFDIDNKRRLLKVSLGSERVVSARVAWHPSGTAFAAGNLYGNVGVWDAESGRQLSVAQPHIAAVLSLDWLPNGQRIASLGEDGTVKILDPWSGEETLALSSEGGAGALTALKWSSDGTRLAIGNADGQIRIWDASKAYAFGTNSIYSKTLASMHRMRSRQNLTRRDWEGALREISSAIELEPGNAAYRCSRGLIQIRLGKMELALADLDAACGLAPDDKAVLFHRLELYGVLERWNDALADASRLVDLEQSFYARYKMAMIHLILGQSEAYRKICQEILEMYRDVVTLDFDRLRLLALTSDGRDECERLVAMLRERADTPTGQDAATLGALFYRAGRLEEAVEHLTNANRAWQQTGSISATGRSHGDMLPGETWYFLAMSCHDMGRYQEALTWYEKAEAYTQDTLVKHEVPRDVVWPDYWHQRISLQWLQREARSRLGISEADMGE